MKIKLSKNKNTITNQKKFLHKIKLKIIQKSILKINYCQENILQVRVKMKKI